MRRKTVRGRTAKISTEPSHSTFSLRKEDDAAVPRTSIETNHDDLQYVREVNRDNSMEEGYNINPHDSLDGDYIFIDLLRRRICVSCNEGGEVLVCAEKDCPVALHAKCFCIDPKFDDMGNFYCPYCYYKRALAETQEFRKNTMIAKKNLCNFFRRNVITSDKLFEKDVETKRKDPKELPVMGNGSSLDHCNRQGNDSVCHSRHLRTSGDQQKEMERGTDGANQHGLAVEDEPYANPGVTNLGGSGYCREEKTPVDIKLVHKQSINGEKFDVHVISRKNETKSVERKEEIKLKDSRYNNENVHASIVENAIPLSVFRFEKYTDVHSPDIAFTNGMQESTEVYVDDMDEEKSREKLVHNELKVSATNSSASEINISDSEALSIEKSRIKKCAQRTAYSHRLSSVRKSLAVKRDVEGINALHKNEEVATSEILRLPQGSYMQCCSKKLTSKTGKRRRLNWTAEEENTLKEGVLRFSMENRNIPWRKILEFGGHVFDNNRTPVDLKDKWKNMTAKEG